MRLKDVASHNKLVFYLDSHKSHFYALASIGLGLLLVFQLVSLLVGRLVSRSVGRSLLTT